MVPSLPESRIKLTLLGVCAFTLSIAGWLLFSFWLDRYYVELPRAEIYRKTQAKLCTLVINWDDGQTIYSTGFLVAPNKVATSQHSVAYAESAFVVCNVQMQQNTKIRKHHDQDLAILDVEGIKGKGLPISRRHVSRLTGKTVYVVRNKSMSDPAIVTGRILGYDPGQKQLALFMFQPLTGGNSGSPVLLGNGEVIGVVSNVWSVQQNQQEKPRIYFAALAENLHDILGGL